ncbi:MAG: DUF711 family protein [Gammaproteobacteria bacterium]
MIRRICLWMFGLVSLNMVATCLAQEAAATLPRVRTITAFVRLSDPFDAQIGEALKVLRDAKAEFEHRGYEVQTIRIVTQPLAELVNGMTESQALGFLKRFDDLSAKEGFMPNVGPAMLKDSDDPKTMHLLAQVLSTLPHINASSILADDDGIHWKTVRETAVLVRYVTDHSPHSQGNFNFTATAMLKPLGPYYPGTYHTGVGHQFAIGFESANVVQTVFARTHGNFDESVSALTQALTVHAKVAEAVGDKIAAASGWKFMGVDPTPAPLGDVSIGAAMEAYTGARFGSSGTLTAALIITTAVKAVPVRQIGYSGLMVPVMEDRRLAQRWAEGEISTDTLLAYSAVCGTGLDTIPYPGDISEEQLARIFGDVASLAFKWHKPLSARLLPVKGKKAGEMTEFSSQYLFNTRLQVLP